MTRKEYCLNHEPIATHNFYAMQIHGIEYGINDYAYVSRIYQKSYCGKKSVMFHKVKIYYDADGCAYINLCTRKFDGKRDIITLKIDDFIRLDNWCVPTFNITDYMDQV